MPPMVASTVSSSPWETVLTYRDRLSNTTFYRSALAQLVGGHVLGRQVRVGEAERLDDVQPVAAGVQLVQLLVERGDKVVLALAEDEPAGLDLLLAVDLRHEPVGDLERGAGVLLEQHPERDVGERAAVGAVVLQCLEQLGLDRKSTRLNSSHVRISYAVFCLKKKK